MTGKGSLLRLDSWTICPKFLKNNKERIYFTKQLLEFTDFENTRVKWTVADVFSIYCEDFWRKIQDGDVSKKECAEFVEETHKLVFSVAEKLQSSQSSRLRAAAALVLTDYVILLPQPLMMDTYGGSLVESALTAISSDHPYIKEKSMALLVSVAAVMKESFDKYYEKVFQTVSAALEKTEETTSDELKGRAIECISLSAHFLGSAKAEPFREMIVNKLVDLHKRILEEKEHMKTGVYVISAWERCAGLFKQDTTLFILEKYWPSLKELLKDMFLLSQTELGKHENCHDHDHGHGNGYGELHACGVPAPEEDSCCSSVNKGTKRKNDTDPIEYAEESLRMIQTFARVTGGKFYPYVEDTFGLLFEVLQKHESYDDQSVRTLLSEAFDAVIQSVKESNNPNKDALLLEKIIIMIGKVQELVKKYNLDCYPDLTEDVLLLLSGVLEKVGPILNEEKVQSLCELAWKTMELWAEIISNAEQEYEAISASKEAEDVEEAMEIESEIADMIELMISCTKFCGSLMKVYREKTLKLRDFLMTKMIPLGVKSKNEDKIKFSLFVYIDILEYLGLEFLPSEWWNNVHGLLMYLEHPNTAIRHAAAYGLGILATKKGDLFEENSTLYFGKLLIAFKKQKEAVNKAEAANKEDNDDEEGKDDDDGSLDEERSTLDNITAAIGKFIEAKPSLASEASAQDWFKQLPLQEDLDEAVHQGTVLANIILKEEYKQVKEFLLGSDGAYKNAIIEVLEEMISDQVYDKISDILKEANNKLNQ